MLLGKTGPSRRVDRLNSTVLISWLRRGVHNPTRLGIACAGIDASAADPRGSTAAIRRPIAAQDCRGGRATREPGSRYAVQAPRTLSEFWNRIGVGPQLSSDRQRETPGQLYQPLVS